MRDKDHVFLPALHGTHFIGRSEARVRSASLLIRRICLPYAVRFCEAGEIALCGTGARRLAEDISQEMTQGKKDLQQLQGEMKEKEGHCLQLTQAGWISHDLCALAACLPGGRTHESKGTRAFLHGRPGGFVQR